MPAADDPQQDPLPPVAASVAQLTLRGVLTGMLLGGLLAWLFARLRPVAAQRFSVVIAAGLIAGESMVGVAFAMRST
jgi:uncharacterized oligopeptide transporter (OPT) family protein